MRRVELSTELPAPAEVAWAVFLDTEAWPSWGGLVTSAAGVLEPGQRWTMTLRPERGRPRRMTPTLWSVGDRALAFETRIAGRWGVRIVHRFELEEAGDAASVLRQVFEVTGALVRPLWGPVSRGVLQFDELGADLARRLARGPA